MENRHQQVEADERGKSQERRSPGRDVSGAAAGVFAAIKRRVDATSGPAKTTRSLALAALLMAGGAAALYARPADAIGGAGPQSPAAAAAPSSAGASSPAGSTPAVTNHAAATTGAAGATGSTGDNPNLPPTAKQEALVAPVLAKNGIDIHQRSEQILAHLSAALRFYHTATAPVQKVGEPSDVIYAEENSSQAARLTALAFQSARSEASMLDRMEALASGKDTNAAQPTEAQRLQALRDRISAQLTALQAEDADLSKQIATARGQQAVALRQRQQEVEGELQLQKAMNDTMTRVGSLADAQHNTGLSADIDRLGSSAPELATAATKPPVPPALQNLTAARQGGVQMQAVVLFQLLGARHTIDAQIKEADALRKQAIDLRAPILAILRNTIQQGQAATTEAPPTAPASTPTLAAAATASPKAADAAPLPKAANASASTAAADSAASTHQRYDTLTATFQVLSSAVLPLSQEMILLEQDRTTLTGWQTAVNLEYKEVLRALLMRVISIAVVLTILFVLNQLWGRATIRYVHDLRRRRQLLVVRRAVIGFLTGIVLLLGFVSQVSSLATFAGFISAGIAVGLQTILLSVAAYFFIVGRYGVRVGDRITVAGVTGDVIEVGLARFYLMELTGAGTTMHPTGRVAVFANSILFQTGTPLYKQLPGTEYAWHELSVKLAQGVDYQPAVDAATGAINAIYAGYKERIDQQHAQVEAWMGTALPKPDVLSRVQLTEAGLQLTVLFPVELANAGETDEAITEKLLATLGSDPKVKAAVEGTPVIKASIKT